MLRKELLDFIKKYNKEFAIKGYSKLSKPDLQSKVEDVLKRKIPRSMIFKEYQGLKNKPAPKKVAPKKVAPKKAAAKKKKATKEDEVRPVDKNVPKIKKKPKVDKPSLQKVMGIMREVGKENLKTGREIKEIPLTSLTLYDPERRKRQGDETYYLKLRDKALTSGEFAKWFRTGKTIYKEARAEIKELFQKIKDDGVKLYFAQSFYRSNWGVSRGDKYLDAPKHRRDLDLQIVAIKNGKLVNPAGTWSPPYWGEPKPLYQKDFEDAQDWRGPHSSSYFDIKFFKKDDMGYKISSGIV